MHHKDVRCGFIQDLCRFFLSIFLMLFLHLSSIIHLPSLYSLCSAGVGRTGTFISIDVALKQIDAESTLDIFNYVRHMRFKRNYMVQTAVSDE